MRMKNLFILSLCGCLLTGCGSSQIDGLENVQSIEEETEKVEMDVENKENSKPNQDNSTQKKNNSTSGNTNKKKSDSNSGANNQPEKKEQKKSSSKKEQSDKKDTKKDVDTLVKGAEEQAKSQGYKDLTLTGVYEASYEGKVIEYQIGFLTGSNNGLLIGYNTENGITEKNCYSDAWKMSHHVNGVCGPGSCPGDDNYYYASAGEVNAAIIRSRQAYEWKVLYEKEEPDFDLFDNGQEEVISNDNESSSGVLDISAFKAYTTNVVTFGLYEQDNNLENGPEEIEWFKIDSPDGNKTLLVSKYVLSAAHGDVMNGWNNSEMRDWLNSEFYENAFTSEEKEKILDNDSACASKEVTINSDVDGVISARVREESSVKDKVFILSMDGITGNLEEIEKLCVITPYAAYEPHVILEERYGGSGENINPKDYDYALASMATRCSVDVDLDYAERGTVVWVGPDYGFGGFFGATPFVGLGIRPCIWISK